MPQPLEKARVLIAQHALGGIITLSPVYIRYMTGLSLSRGTLLVGRERASLFIDRRYAFAAVSLSPDFEVVVSSSIEEEKAALKQRLELISGPVGFDPATTTVDQFETLSAFGGRLEPCAALFSVLRRPKSLLEINAIQDACTLCAKGFHFLLHQLREGVTEAQLVQALKAFWFANGAESISFDPIIAFGPNSACPHWPSSSFALEKNATVLIDIGVATQGYHSDMTRTVFFGRPDPEIAACKAVVLEAYRLGEQAARPGISPFALDALVREYIRSKGYGEFFVHGLGHGVGLQVHEPPRLSELSPNEPPLGVGDIITIEPGIYLPGRGGVRIENTVVIELSGARSLIPVPLE